MTDGFVVLVTAMMGGVVLIAARRSIARLPCGHLPSQHHGPDDQGGGTGTADAGGAVVR
jgi:hypothetical protein